MWQTKCTYSPCCNCQILLQGDPVLHNWTQGVQEASTGEVGSPITIPSSFWQPQVEPVQGEVKLSLKLAPLDNSHLEERSVARLGLNTDSAQQLTLHKSSGNSSQLNFYDLRAHAQDLPVTESSHGKPPQSAIPTFSFWFILPPVGVSRLLQSNHQTVITNSGQDETFVNLC